MHVDICLFKLKLYPQRINKMILEKQFIEKTNEMDVFSFLEKASFHQACVGIPTTKIGLKIL